MLKLVYHTAVFGPIDLEYDQPVIRVGRSEDNDLVLQHPSILPRHCLLVFRDEKVLCLPPGLPMPDAIELQSLTGTELGPTDLLQLGDLQFSLAHSPRTVALPEHVQGSLTGDAAAGVDEQPGQRRYYCALCRAFIQDANVKRMGLVGHDKHDLCPKCGRLLARLEPPKPSSDSRWRQLISGLSRVIGKVRARSGGSGR